MTVPPPPAVPGELIRRVDALAAVIRRVDPRHDLGAGALAEALLPFIGGIVEAARRDALTEAAEAIGSLAGRFHTPNWNDALNEAGRVLTDLIDDATADLRSAP